MTIGAGMGYYDSLTPEERLDKFTEILCKGVYRYAKEKGKREMKEGGKHYPNCCCPICGGVGKHLPLCICEVCDEMGGDHSHACICPECGMPSNNHASSCVCPECGCVG